MSAITHILKYAMLSLLTVPIAIALTNCTPETNIPLRIGSNLWTGYETLYLARDLGYYNDKPIRLVDYPSGTEEVRAYRNKEIEGAGLSIDQALVLAATQENIRIIAIMDVSNGGDVILGKPEFTDMKALKGKRVGVESTALGAFFITRALEKNDMTAKDIQIVWEIVDTLAVSQEAIANSPDAIQALVDGRFRALDYFEKNPQDAATRMAKRTKVTPEQILESFKGLSQPNLQANQKLLDKSDPALINGMTKLVKIMVDNKLLPKTIDPASILDDRFIKNAKV